MNSTLLKTRLSASLIKNIDTLVILSFLIGSLMTNLYLWYQYQKKNAELNTIVKLKSNIEVQAPTLSVIKISGERVTVNYNDDDRPTLLYIFVPGCSWCERNISNINLLADERNNSYRFIGLSLAKDRLKEYLDNHKFSFPVYTDIDQQSFDVLELGATPQTILISTKGKILRSWKGAYTGEIKNEIEELFKLRLPTSISLDTASEAGSMFGSSCVYCFQDGHIFSIGSVIKKENSALECKVDGKWMAR